MADLSDASNAQMRKFTDKGGPLAAKWCATCDNHYRFCPCATPVWRLRNEGELGPMPGEPNGPRTLADIFGLN